MFRVLLTCYWRLCLFFFFSSRRRHTRWPRDWSSDVCSSDLVEAGGRDCAQGTLAEGAVRCNRERDEIDDVQADDLTYFRGSAEPVPFNRTEVGAQQLQGLGSSR